MRRKSAIKKLAIGVSHFITRRGKLAVLLIAVVTLICLAVRLSGYVLFDITSNYQSSNTIPNKLGTTTPDESRIDITNQGKIAFLDQSNSNSSDPPENTVSDAGVLKAIGIGVYWDSSLTSKVSTTYWDLLQPSAQKSLTVYVYNEGNSPVTLSLSTSNWTPSTASTYLALTWNYNGQTISPSAQMQVELTLTVSSNITGISNFSFDITIAASS
jgi:hypothetical protein